MSQSRGRRKGGGNLLQIKAVTLIEPRDETHRESLQQPEFAKKAKHTHTQFFFFFIVAGGLERKRCCGTQPHLKSQVMNQNYFQINS